MFTNHNQQITQQKKLRKNRRHSISHLSHMKEILLNFQWHPPSKTRKPADQTLKTSSCEISFWALRRVCVAIVTFFEFRKFLQNFSETYIKIFQNNNTILFLTSVSSFSYPFDFLKFFFLL